MTYLCIMENLISHICSLGSKQAIWFRGQVVDFPGLTFDIELM